MTIDSTPSAPSGSLGGDAGAGMSSAFAQAVRSELIGAASPTTNVRNAGSRGQWARRWPWRIGGVAVLIAAGGTAYALSSVLPGGTEVTGLSAPIGATHTGSADIDLGPRPDDATGVEVGFRCLSAGYFGFPDGSSGSCDGQEPRTPDGQPPTMARFPLSPGQHTIHIDAGPNTRWEAQSRYVNERATDWKVNANGQTYGVPKDNREPELQAVVATNGLLGYAFTRDLNAASGPPPTDPAEAAARKPVSVDIPVYESDGTTRIGDFHVGN